MAPRKTRKKKSSQARILGRSELRTAGVQIKEVYIPEFEGAILMGPVSARVVVDFQDVAAKRQQARDSEEELAPEEQREVLDAMFAMIRDTLVDENGQRLYEEADDLLDEVPVQTLLVIGQAITNALLESMEPVGGGEGNS